MNELISKLTKWGRLFLPHYFLKYYPPVFVVRNPVEESVYSSFKKGYNVTVIVFKLTNFAEIVEQIGENEPFQQKLKKVLKRLITKKIPVNEIIVLQDYHQDGFALFLKHKENVFNTENLISKLKTAIVHAIESIYPSLHIVLEACEMSVEKGYGKADQAIFNAYQQVSITAERRLQSEYTKMLFEMKNIISEKLIDLLAQPIIDVASSEIKAWEILTRGPKGTLYESPLQLFSIAKQTNLLYRLEFLVLEQAFKKIIEIECKHLVFVNFTPKTMGNSRFASSVKQLLFKYPEISPLNIIFEVTEGESLEGAPYFHKNMKELRALGIRLAVDDTGSGYASLHMISEVMPDIIKIDQSVIKDIDKNKVKESMLKGLLIVAKEIGSLVVAEGIEKKEEASVLSRHNVDLAQGYYYAKPGSMVKQNVS